MQKEAFAIGIGERFWTLTPYEFFLAVRAYRENESAREKQAWRRTAALGSWILGAWGVKKKPEQLVPAVFPSRLVLRPGDDPASFAAAIREKKERLRRQHG